MEARPKLAVPQTPLDQAGELLAWGALAALWALTIWSFSQLPATIPVHFDGLGAPDRYGDKGSLLVLPLVATGLFGVFTALGRFPHVLNYASPITPANALGQCRAAMRLARGLKTGIALTFLLLVFRTWQTATGQAAGLGAWFLPAVLGLLLVVPGLWYVATVARSKP